LIAIEETQNPKNNNPRQERKKKNLNKSMLEGRTIVESSQFQSKSLNSKA